MDNKINIFFNKLCYKNKAIYFSSLLLTTSIVCPLTSCGSDNTSNDIGGFDKEFGFDAQTYNNLERQFTSKYGAFLKGKTVDENEYINKFENFLQNDLSTLRNKLFDPAKNYSFTIRTNTLLDYASKNFNIQLNRNANVSEVDFGNLKQSSLENFVIYMENMGFTEDEIAERKTEFNKKFASILDECKLKYPTDNAQILMQLHADVIDCWQDLNDDFAHMSAYNHLKKFFNEYEFKVKENNINELLWNNLLRNSDFMGSKDNIGKIDQDIDSPIKDEWINRLFSISKISKWKKGEVALANNNLNNKSTDKIPDFNSKEIIPGYVLTPVLKTMSQDIYSNNYYMNIDWQLMSNTYKDKDQKTQDKVIAHLAYNKDGQIVNSDGSSNYFDDNKLSSDNYQFTKYSLMATPVYQQKKMNEAYFDQTKEPDQKITFSWNKDMVGIESFLKSDSIGANGEYNLPQEPYEVSFSSSNLSSMGLQLNNKDLSDLLNKKNNLKDKQSINNVNNNDNLKIEEKFVKYCDINADAIVSFSDNKISNNSIQNKFIVTFINSTSMKNNVGIKSTLNNIEPSNIFCNNAVDFYDEVVNYVDGKKIQDEIESHHWLAIVIWIELGILFSIIIILLILTLVQYKQLFYIGHGIRQKIVLEPFGRDANNIKFNFKCIFFLSIATIFLCLLWKFAISDRISEEVDNVKKWNEMIINRSKSDPNYKINVIDKVNGEDKDNFKTADDFMKYYKTNSNSAFASYFYYFHFVELLQKLTDDESSIILTNTDVKKDYNDFNNKKKTCKINDKIYSRSIVAILSFILIVYVSYMVCYNFVFTRNVISWRKDWNVRFDHDWENNVDNVRDGVQQLRDHIINFHNPFYANYDQPIDAAHAGIRAK